MENAIKSIAVFCGSSDGTEQIFKDQATLLGKRLAEEKIALVYGGANVGLMGALADGALSQKGNVMGVLPNFLKSREIAHERLTNLSFVNTMHERKAMMSDLADGFIALPGGYGTLEELFEILTWRQLSLHIKPIGILNINGFYDHLIGLLSNMVDKGFLKGVNKDMLLVSNNIDDLLFKMKNFKATKVDK
ncbi:LOG family protein [Tenacibaculum agarivorans]|uniref:LOG family protein n=1 Tax=Tenacibaculum agarivorans TaxID=1908389 RepID=UPI00094B922E|nr:TIGR00730 family Rossman fold protein [Tenacibaculum agarivorans]